MVIDHDKLNEFLGKAVVDIGAAWSANMVLLGDKLGLYKAMAMLGATTPAQLANATGTAERYIREWLGNQAAGGREQPPAEEGRSCQEIQVFGPRLVRA